MMSRIDRLAFFDRDINRISVSLNCFQLNCSILDETEISISASITKSVVYTVANLRFSLRSFLFAFSVSGVSVTATNYWLDGPGLESQQRQEILFSAESFRPALEPT